MISNIALLNNKKNKNDESFLIIVPLCSCITIFYKEKAPERLRCENIYNTEHLYAVLNAYPEVIHVQSTTVVPTKRFQMLT